MTYLHRLGHRKQRQFRGPRNIWGSLLQELQGQSFAAYQGLDRHCQKQLRALAVPPKVIYENMETRDAASMPVVDLDKIASDIENSIVNPEEVKE